MAIPLPELPEFGRPLPVAASPETIDFLARRRSASALTLSAPGPTDADVRALVSLASRAPDHGKLAPWRFIVLRDAAKSAFVEDLSLIAANRPDGPKAQAKLGKLKAPPVCIAVISRHVHSEIPDWEQDLSAGAVCTLLIIAAQAAGFGANWITDWYAYDQQATQRLGVMAEEKVAGFILLGTPTDAPLERVRPPVDALLTTWVP